MGVPEHAQDDKQAVRHALERLGLHGGEDFEAAGRAWKALDRLTHQGVVSPRQDSLDNQLRDVRKLAEQAGCYAAADWIRARTLYESDTDHPRGVVG